MDDWRSVLYPLGFISSLAFGSRVLLQWFESEKAKQSVVSTTFWKLSLLGNLSLLLHSVVQLQYGVALVQTCNAVISWRNLNLMQKPEHQWGLKAVIALLFTALLALTTFFWLINPISWFQIPQNPWFETPATVNPLWHGIGLIGLLLFSSRFWVQWYDSEYRGRSHLGRPFWWLSLIGDTLALSYFFHIKDPVNLIGPTLGLIPYIRNLMLSHKAKPSPAVQE